jgi:hypothetical protein
MSNLPINNSVKRGDIFALGFHRRNLFQWLSNAPILPKYYRATEDAIFPGQIIRLEIVNE